MFRLYRTKLQSTETEWRDVYLDLWVDRQGFAKARMPTFGFRGDGFDKNGVPKPNVAPFILQKDGIMDFGDDDENPAESDVERIAKCNIYLGEHRVAIGEYLSIFDEDEEVTYQFVNCTEIATSTR